MVARSKSFDSLGLQVSTFERDVLHPLGVGHLSLKVYGSLKTITAWMKFYSVNGTFICVSILCCNLSLAFNLVIKLVVAITDLVE